MRLRATSTSSTFTLTISPALTTSRVLHERIGQGRNVDQAILVHTDIDEGTKVYVAPHLEHHALAQILDVLDALGEACRLELGAWISARLLQFLEDVTHGRHAKVASVNCSAFRPRRKLPSPISALIGRAVLATMRSTTG